MNQKQVGKHIIGFRHAANHTCVFNMRCVGPCKCDRMSLQLTKACICIYLVSCIMNSKFKVQLVNGISAEYLTRRFPKTDN